MFKSYYGFHKNPFDKQSLAEKDAFASRDHQEMVNRLNYLKEIKGIGLFTADSGFGKTYALRCFAHSLDKNLFQMAYVCLSTVSITEFYRQFCRELGLEPHYSKTAMFKAIKERLYYLFKEKRRPLVLALDEAHELAPSILKDIKMIMNNEFDSLNCFILVLLGEPHLNRIIEKPVHESLRQRIVIHYNFSGLDGEEIERYVRHKLDIGGAAQSILGEAAMSAIAGYCHGNPRLIDLLMTEALSLGAQLHQPSLDGNIFMAAANNLALA